MIIISDYFISIITIITSDSVLTPTSHPVPRSRFIGVTHKDSFLRNPQDGDGTWEICSVLPQDM